MAMSVSPAGNGSGGGFDPSKMASKMASKMMSDLDPNNTGKVTKDQFISGLISKGVSSADATKIYDSIDTKKTGSIGKSDIEAAFKNGNLKPPSGGPQGGSRGAEKPGGASSSSTTYAAADTNQDGVVSAQEAAVYAMKHPSVSTTDSTKTDSSMLGKNVDKMV
jgi:hypothetical protein